MWTAFTANGQLRVTSAIRSQDGYPALRTASSRLVPMLTPAAALRAAENGQPKTGKAELWVPGSLPHRCPRSRIHQPGSLERSGWPGSSPPRSWDCGSRRPGAHCCPVKETACGAISLRRHCRIRSWGRLHVLPRMTERHWPCWRTLRRPPRAAPMPGPWSPAGPANDPGVSH